MWTIEEMSKALRNMFVIMSDDGSSFKIQLVPELYKKEVRSEEY